MDSVDVVMSRNCEISAETAAAPNNVMGAAAGQSAYEMIEITELPKKVSKFRVNRRSTGLTYSCPVNSEDHPFTNKEELRDHLLQLVPIPVEYCVCEETHKNGKRHYHAYIVWDHKVDIKDARHFDFKGVHPEIRKVDKGWLKYLMKDGNYESTLSENPYARIATVDTWKEAQDILIEDVPRDFFLYGERIKSNYESRKRKAVDEVLYNGPYPREWEFPWDEIRQNKTIVIRGRARRGKTQFIKYMMKHIGEPCFYFKGNFNALKKYRGEAWIIMDDPTGIDESCWNELIDVEGHNEVRVLHGTVEIPSGVHRIIITNEEHEGGIQFPPFQKIQERLHEIQWFINDDE